MSTHNHHFEQTLMLQYPPSYANPLIVDGGCISPVTFLPSAEVRASLSAPLASFAWSWPNECFRFGSAELSMVVQRPAKFAQRVSYVMHVVCRTSSKWYRCATKTVRKSRRKQANCKNALSGYPMRYILLSSTFSPLPSQGSTSAKLSDFFCLLLG